MTEAAAPDAQPDAQPATLPDALVVGPMKCGTSWIHDYLEARGDICLPGGVKETFYFDRYHARGPGWYGAHFQGFDAGAHLRRIEVAPSIFPWTPEVPDRVRAQLGDIPVVVTLRDPVRRAWSHYQHLRRGYTRKPLAEAVREYPEIVEASRYSVHLPAWQARFSAVTVLRLEDLREAPEAYEARLCAALGIPARGAAALDTRPVNEASVPASYHLASLGHFAANTLRRAGFYGAVSAAKRLGLKRVFFGGATRKLEMQPADAAFLAEALGEERARHAGAGETPAG